METMIEADIEKRYKEIEHLIDSREVKCIELLEPAIACSNIMLKTFMHPSDKYDWTINRRLEILSIYKPGKDGTVLFDSGYTSISTDEVKQLCLSAIREQYCKPNPYSRYNIDIY